MFRGKNYKASIASFDKTNSFEPEEAMKIVVDTAKAKFDETIELHVMPTSKSVASAYFPTAPVKPSRFW